jgi:ribokinase
VPFDVAVVGSLNLDLVAVAPRLPGPGETVSGTSYAEHAGGKGLNQAVAAARAGASVAMVGAVGDDDAGVRLRSIAHTEGIDITGLVTESGATTGRALITVDAAAENSIVVVAGANALVTGNPVPQARVVIAQMEIPVAAVTEAFRSARASGATTILNPAPAHVVSDGLLGLCDIVVPNEHELELVGGLDRLFDGGAGVVITTRGAHGVSVARRVDGTTFVHEQAAFDVRAVDTTGAGDAFCGSLAARLATGEALEHAVRYAAASGALATTRQGAVPSLPRRSEVQRLLADSAM